MRSVGIAVHEECGAGRKCDFGGGVVGLGVDAQNEFGGQPQEFGPAVGVAEQGWRVSSGGFTQLVVAGPVFSGWFGLVRMRRSALRWTWCVAGVTRRVRQSLTSGR